MLASLDQACGGSAQLVRLVGEAGIGKSRLVKEFVARVGDEDRFQQRRRAAGRLLTAGRTIIWRLGRSGAQRCRDDAKRQWGRNAGEARGACLPISACRARRRSG